MPKILGKILKSVSRIANQEPKNIESNEIFTPSAREIAFFTK
jgi:hypothetical protein